MSTISRNQNQPQDQPLKPTRGRPATGRQRNKLLQIRLSDQEHNILVKFVHKHRTNATKLIRDMVVQLITDPSPEETITVNAKGNLLHLPKQQAKQLLVDLTSQL